MSNPHGGPETWGINYNNTFEWNLRIKPEASFRPGLESGSRRARFDARVKSKLDYKYINPFTGEVGDKSIGTHLFLE